MGRRAVTIGLVNNMSDEALKVTERQFRDLIGASAGDDDVELRLFAFTRTARSPRALDYISARYEPVSAAMNGDLDALIITGAQPRTALRNEDYWPELTEVIDWAKRHTVSTIFSCLAAHAAVLHLDGIERRRLQEKCTGAFAFSGQREHPLSGEAGNVRIIPHSRYNGLLRSDLERAGYEILTSSPAHGVDMFIKSFGSQFVFLQGHLEYDANSLAREYRRDMGQYLRGETDRLPTRPKGYFGAAAEAALDALALRASQDRSSALLEELTTIEALAPVRAEWRDAATSFYRNWINSLAPRATLAPEPALLTVEAGAH
ncbi:MAG: homoserine O-succinyltransferase [Hyphomicrobiales bacterium]|nr:homoserine O-succinyltransferase [Hyphomicrobiales bacterium]